MTHLLRSDTGACYKISYENFHLNEWRMHTTQKRDALGELAPMDSVYNEFPPGVFHWWTCGMFFCYFQWYKGANHDSCNTRYSCHVFFCDFKSWHEIPATPYDSWLNKTDSMSFVSLIGSENSKFHRFRFLHESLQNLDNSFQKNGGRLYTFRGETIRTLEMLIKVNHSVNRDLMKLLFNSWPTLLVFWNTHILYLSKNYEALQTI